MAKILLVEDNEALCMAFEAYFTAEHHVVDAVTSGDEGLERALYCSYEVIVLDWDLPGISGLEICKRFRERGGMTPILMLTGKNLIKEKTAGLDSGADDYLTKPFEMPELSSRIRALLRRPAVVQTTLLRALDLEVDPTTASVKKAGLDVHLLPKEFALLEFFMRHPEQPFNAQALVERVWSTDSEISAECIRPYINRLRAKIDTADRPSFIQTLRGKGYVFKLAPALDATLATPSEQS
jgi:DNA-binding response OmpR family regulator